MLRTRRAERARRDSRANATINHTRPTTSSADHVGLVVTSGGNEGFGDAATPSSVNGEAAAVSSAGAGAVAAGSAALAAYLDGLGRHCGTLFSPGEYVSATPTAA